MKIIVVALFFACISCENLFLPNTIPENFTSCEANPIIHINQTFTLTVPTKGENSTYIFLGSVSSIVQMKQVVMAVYLDDVLITSFTYPDSQVFSPGETFEYKFYQLIPSYSPSGTYTMHFQFIDVTGRMDACIKVVYTLN